MLESAAELGHDGWFRLGDRDTALHLIRSEALRRGEPLSAITRRLTAAFGVTATLVLGKHSGRHAVQRRCEQIGHALEGQALDQVYQEVIAHADREKVVNDSDLTAIVARVNAATGAAAGGNDRPKPSTAPASQDFTSTPAEIGYGHGV